MKGNDKSDSYFFAICSDSNAKREQKLIAERWGDYKIKEQVEDTRGDFVNNTGNLS